jgi:opacity protein-like surface antigen
MKKGRGLGIIAVWIFINALATNAQTAWEPSRFSIGGAPLLSEPRGEFRQNIGSNFGGIGGVVYHIDRPGFFGVRFDVSGIRYGYEKRRVPISESITRRVLVDVVTTNSITALSLGPELALPRGPLRPYVNAGISEQLFRTTSSVTGIGSEEAFATTTNHKYNTAAWFLGGGIRIPLAGNDAKKAISLDLGLRYNRGGTASYLREGSIQENGDGSITFTPLSSRTAQLVYLIGVRFRIPHNPLVPCHRLLC